MALNQSDRKVGRVAVTAFVVLVVVIILGLIISTSGILPGDSPVLDSENGAATAPQ